MIPSIEREIKSFLNRKKKPPTGKVVSDALRSVSNRLHVAYQPPYMPNVNPTELVNSQLKQQLKASSIDEQMSTLNDKLASQLLVQQQIGDILTNHISIDNVDTQPLDNVHIGAHIARLLQPAAALQLVSDELKIFRFLLFLFLICVGLIVVAPSLSL